MAAPSGDEGDETESADHVDGKRFRFYPDSASSPYVVFIRQIKKSINLKLLSDELVKNYPSVQEMKKVHFSKMRVVLGDKGEANNLIKDPRFNAYYVYIPSKAVEIDGVVVDLEVTPEQLKTGIGRFRDRTRAPVQILEVSRLFVPGSHNPQILVATKSLRVTFAGSVLPDFVELYKVLLPVRLYNWRPMHCEKCQRFGHTKKFCSNKPRCPKCGVSHESMETCSNTDPQRSCFHCKGNHESIRECPKYKERKKQLRTRSNASYANVLSQNPFGDLTEEDDSDISDTTDSDDVPEPQQMPAGKRKRTTRKKPSKQQKLSSSPPLTKTTDVSPNLTNEKLFPLLKPKIIKRKSEINPKKASGISFSQLVDLVCDAFAFSPQAKKIVIVLKPALEQIWKMICLHVPIFSQLVHL